MIAIQLIYISDKNVKGMLHLRVSAAAAAMTSTELIIGKEILVESPFVFRLKCQLKPPTFRARGTRRETIPNRLSERDVAPRVGEPSCFPEMVRVSSKVYC